MLFDHVFLQINDCLYFQFNKLCMIRNKFENDRQMEKWNIFLNTIYCNLENISTNKEK